MNEDVREFVRRVKEEHQRELATRSPEERARESALVEKIHREAIEQVIGQMPSKHKGRLASLLTLNFQVFDNVSLLAA